jgi:hypothetical protein
VIFPLGNLAISLWPQTPQPLDLDFGATQYFSVSSFSGLGDRAAAHKSWLSVFVLFSLSLVVLFDLLLVRLVSLFCSC